ncbi:COMM domain-containing protein 1 [Tieghemostelium lacteum]|uniref:COMM domain-containing protein 1 n=1 Tax=Tieghemostelium lacteum TaxID=361077 RepID=A0A152A362_TIELA|nr:COMM domain-containing protein 1 [Tieghemostelium lacteum]|eukprot:KYR00545.1 COMM domain-containing protein 1 [Tieghemostelium lacteum]
MDQPKLFSSLLGFLLKREYENDESLSSLDSLKEMIFSEVDISMESIESMYIKCLNFIKNSIASDYNLSTFESIVKENKEFTDMQQECLIKFWKLNKKKIHEIIYKKTRFNNSLSKMSWRIDLKTKTKDIEEINEAVSIVELKLSNSINSSNSNKLIRFEMDRAQLENTLQNINNIQKHLQATNTN